MTDRTALAAGLPDGVDLAAVASFAAAEIALLDEGRVSLVDRTLSMTGETADALAGRSAPWLSRRSFRPASWPAA